MIQIGTLYETTVSGILFGETLRGCTIFLRNRLSAPQKQVHVRLACRTSVFAPRTFFGRRPKQMCGYISPQAGKKKLSLYSLHLFVASIRCKQRKFGALFGDLFDKFILSLFVAFLFEGSSKLWRSSLSEDKIGLQRVANTEEPVVSMMRMVAYVPCMYLRSNERKMLE